MAADEVVLALFDCPTCADNRVELERLRGEVVHFDSIHYHE